VRGRGRREGKEQRRGLAPPGFVDGGKGAG
jgi:hypothetical protein